MKFKLSVTNPSSFLSAAIADFFPIAEKALVELHPVRACITGSTSDLSRPISEQIFYGNESLFVVFPCLKSSPILSNNVTSRQIAATSVSMLQTTSFLVHIFPWHTECEKTFLNLLFYDQILVHQWLSFLDK